VSEFSLSEAVAYSKEQTRFATKFWMRNRVSIGWQKIRSLGIMTARGTSVLAICKADGFEQIENPYVE
jgi:hypothetical protein